MVTSQFKFHLNGHNYFSSFQSTYRHGYSTETALLKVVNDQLLAIDEGKLSVLILLDSSAVFGTIDHDIITQSTSSCVWYPWHCIYNLGSCHILQKRFQIISIQVTHSGPVELYYGAP